MSKTITKLERLAEMSRPVACDEHCHLWRHRDLCMKAACLVRLNGKAVESRKGGR